jgi:hypothetical protein
LAFFGFRLTTSIATSSIAVAVICSNSLRDSTSDSFVTDGFLRQIFAMTVSPTVRPCGRVSNVAVVATRRRDNDGRFAPTSNCHPLPSLAGEERLRCGPERALDEVAVSELLRRRRIARFARSDLLPQQRESSRRNWRRRGRGRLRRLDHGPAQSRQRWGIDSSQNQPARRNPFFQYREFAWPW